jgi:hypothetical protein
MLKAVRYSITKFYFLIVLFCLATMLSCEIYKPKTPVFSPPEKNQVLGGAMDKQTTVYFKNMCPDTGVGIARIDDDGKDYRTYEEYRTYYREERSFRIPYGHYIITFYDLKGRAILDHQEIKIPRGKGGGKIEFIGECEEKHRMEMRNAI